MRREVSVLGKITKLRETGEKVRRESFFEWTKACNSFLIFIAKLATLNAGCKFHLGTDPR